MTDQSTDQTIAESLTKVVVEVDNPTGFDSDADANVR